MHHAKNRGNKEIPLAIPSRILAQSCVTLCLNYMYVGRVTHDCASILDGIAKGISLFPRFFAWCIPTSIFIQLNEFCTCSTYFDGSRKRSYAHVYTYMHRLARAVFLYVYMPCTCTCTSHSIYNVHVHMYTVILQPQ